MKAVDFTRLAEAAPGHAGLLVLYGENDPTRDLRAETIVAAIERMSETHPGGVAGMILAVTKFRWRPEGQRRPGWATGGGSVVPPAGAHCRTHARGRTRSRAASLPAP
jgi:hypothetical protein